MALVFRLFERSLPVLRSRIIRSYRAVVVVMVAVTMLAGCGSSVDFTNAAPSGAVVPYITPVQQDGKYSLVGLHARDGSEAWRVAASSPYSLGSLSVAGDILYVCELTSPTPSALSPGPVVTVALRLSDGKTLWRTSLPPIGYDVRVVADSSAVFVAGTAAFYALDPSSGTIRWHQTAQLRPWPYLGSDVMVAMLASDEPNTASGLGAWRESDGTQLWQLDASPDLNIVTDQTTVFAREQGIISARSLETGRRLWQFPTGSNLHVGTLLAATGSFVLAQTYTAPSADGLSQMALVELDARTGKQLWTANRTLYDVQPESGPVIGTASTGEITIYGWNGSELLALRGGDGSLMWHATMPPYVPDQAQLLDGVLYVLFFPPSCEFGCWFSAQNERLAALNPATGVAYWQRDLTEEAALAST